MSAIDIPKLVRELEHAGEAWASSDNRSLSSLRDLCRRAALALKQQQDANYREITHRLGVLLIELGKKLTGGTHG